MEVTKALTLKHLKYGDSSLILYFYTEEWGMLPFFFKGFYNSKKKNRALLFPFSEFEISFKNTESSGLRYAKNVQARHSFFQLHTDPIKSLILQLLVEVLYSTLKQDEPNPAMYRFLVHHLSLLDKKTEKYADFHLFLLLQLTSFLGFYPDEKNRELPYFDLQEGYFSYEKNNPYVLSEEDSHLIRRLLVSDFTLQSPSLFNQNQRRILLQHILDYYQLHVPEFREPKSLEIIKSLF